MVMVSVRIPKAEDRKNRNFEQKRQPREACVGTGHPTEKGYELPLIRTGVLIEHDANDVTFAKGPDKGTDTEVGENRFAASECTTVGVDECVDGRILYASNKCMHPSGTLKAHSSNGDLPVSNVSGQEDHPFSTFKLLFKGIQTLYGDAIPDRLIGDHPKPEKLDAHPPDMPENPPFECVDRDPFRQDKVGASQVLANDLSLSRKKDPENIPDSGAERQGHFFGQSTDENPQQFERGFCERGEN